MACQTRQEPHEFNAQGKGERMQVQASWGKQVAADTSNSQFGFVRAMPPKMQKKRQQAKEEEEQTIQRSWSEEDAEEAAVTQLQQTLT